MSHLISVVAKTQVIVVDPASSSVSVSYSGPVGPEGPAGPQGDTGETGPTGPASSAFVLEAAISEPNGTAITAATSVAAIRAPATINGKNLSSVAAMLTTPSSSGVVTIDINRSRRTNATTRSVVSMLSTKLNIDVSEYDSSDATTAAVIDTANDDVQTGDYFIIDIDAGGTGAKGLVVELGFS